MSKTIILTLVVVTECSDDEITSYLKSQHTIKHSFFTSEVSDISIFQKPIDLTHDRPEIHLYNEGERGMVLPEKDS
jgi:hypothetical protein